MNNGNKKQKKDNNCLTNEKLEKVSGGRENNVFVCSVCGKPIEYSTPRARYEQIICLRCKAKQKGIFVPEYDYDFWPTRKKVSARKKTK